jgi:hypothetical protein
MAELIAGRSPLIGGQRMGDRDELGDLAGIPVGDFAQAR